MRDEEKHLNFKMYFIHKKCFSCVTQEETLIRAKGNEAWEEYSRQRMLANAESWLRDADREVALLREALKVQFVQNADGGLEEWDQSAFFEKFDADYKQTRETILNNLKGTTNG
jgi:antibiotic biosynthesis monooxygenase (ABM) superfamily enzyme